MNAAHRPYGTVPYQSGMPHACKAGRVPCALYNDALRWRNTVKRAPAPDQLQKMRQLVRVPHVIARYLRRVIDALNFLAVRRDGLVATQIEKRKT